MGPGRTETTPQYSIYLTFPCVRCKVAFSLLLFFFMWVFCLLALLCFEMDFHCLLRPGLNSTTALAS